MFNELTLDFNSKHYYTFISVNGSVLISEFTSDVLYDLHTLHYFFIIDKPHNPLLNSGAIMSSAILLNRIKPDMKMSEKFDYVTDYLRKMAGGEFVG